LLHATPREPRQQNCWRGSFRGIGNQTAKKKRVSRKFTIIDSFAARMKEAEL